MEINNKEEEEELFLSSGEFNRDNYLSSTIIEDLVDSICGVRLLAPIVFLFSLLLAYHLTIAPYKVALTNVVNEQITGQDLGLVRPILTQSEQLAIQQVTLRAETQFSLPNSHNIKLKHHEHVSKHGNFELPEMFYTGVTFGISWQNPFNLRYTAQSALNDNDLFEDLNKMNPKPTHIMLRSAYYNITNWEEVGYGVYFSYDDLAKQGKLSSDVSSPWKRVSEDIITIARKYRQVYVTIYYPHEFGKHLKVETITDQNKYKYTSIIQSIIPTRTGLDDIKSIAAVWLSAINGTEPTRPSTVYQQAWDETDVAFYANN
eukprot:gene10495-14106_t